MSAEQPKDPGGAELAPTTADSDFALVLARMIESIRTDPSQLRNSIYELARVKLEREAWQRRPPMNLLEIRRLMLSLETAIERVESKFERQEREARRLQQEARRLPQSFEELLRRPATLAIGYAPSDDQLRLSGHDGAAAEGSDEIFASLDGDGASIAGHASGRSDESNRPREHPTAPRDLDAFAVEVPSERPDFGEHLLISRTSVDSQSRRSERSAYYRQSKAGHGRRTTWMVAALAVALLFGAVTAVFLKDRETGLPRYLARSLFSPDRPAEVEQKSIAAPLPAPEPAPPAVPATPSAPSMPLPTVYGVYALVDGELRELEALAGRVPDQRVFMSTLIQTPSHTVVPNGGVRFIVYRRDLATSTPDRLAVRVIAKIKQAMRFVSGKVVTAPIDDHWTIRGKSYDFRVSPMPESREMFLVQPERPEFELPAGRYGLVINGRAYDFAVAGPVTDPVQCLERVEAENGSFYSECHVP
jgi:hypothetical protein